MICRSFRCAGAVTLHIPLKDVPGRLSQAAIARQPGVGARASPVALESGGAACVTGLNPMRRGWQDPARGGDDLRPGWKLSRAEGLDIRVPCRLTRLSADSRNRYDAIICMYHDQALIPIKRSAFTRASTPRWLALHPHLSRPWHGAGARRHRRANPQSLIAALRLADQMAKPRMTDDRDG
jgi:4-hydroxythreonine-4-phosphate dehydrogenase